MKISKLRKILLALKKEKGDLPVYLSRDSEGNGYADLGDKASDSVYCDSKQVVLYPFREDIELEFTK